MDHRRVSKGKSAGELMADRRASPVFILPGSQKQHAMRSARRHPRPSAGGSCLLVGCAETLAVFQELSLEKSQTWNRNYQH